MCTVVFTVSLHTGMLAKHMQACAASIIIVCQLQTDRLPEKRGKQVHTSAAVALTACQLEVGGSLLRSALACRLLHYIHHKYNKEGSLSPFAGLAFHPVDGIIQVRVPSAVLVALVLGTNARGRMLGLRFSICEKRISTLAIGAL